MRKKKKKNFAELKDRHKVFRYVIKKDKTLWLVFVLIFLASIVLYICSQQNGYEVDFHPFFHFIDGVLVSTIASYIFYFINFTIPEVKRCADNKKNLLSLKSLLDNSIGDRYAQFLDESNDIVSLDLFEQKFMDFSNTHINRNKVKDLLRPSLAIMFNIIPFMKMNPDLFSIIDTERIILANDMMRDLFLRIDKLDAKDLDLLRKQIITVYYMKKLFDNLSLTYCN